MKKVLYADILPEYPGVERQTSIYFSTIEPTWPCPLGSKRLCLTIEDWPELTVPLITRKGTVNVMEAESV